MSHGAKGEALRDRFLIMTSDLEIFPDGFFLRSFIELDEYSEDTGCQHGGEKRFYF